ncbi:hypothetical protein BpHYR1_016478 [Brachionus plicatilis]|uniref:Uncharacterized protein n=1 Tax=Brachionus plicatilis TaxID=10195 RepID=A0A3M7RUK0_BRAPC|nr:hypothetical protein BpHYR1_016478 [Brachionus plicatilis]
MISRKQNIKISDWSFLDMFHRETVHILGSSFHSIPFQHSVVAFCVLVNQITLQDFDLFQKYENYNLNGTYYVRIFLKSHNMVFFNLINDKRKKNRNFNLKLSKLD